jgi:protocatechuate 3,4-dioxygenase beta subunit
MVTADDGRFEFKSVRAGKYSLQGARRGFVTGFYDQHEQFSTAIVTGAGVDTENLVLRLSPSAVLTGKVIDESGEPVRRANVTLYREDHSAGVSRVVRFSADTTDDRGSFEFAPLNPGTYYLSAMAAPWYAVHPVSAHADNAPPSTEMVDRNLDVAYPTTYYGDATDSDDAMPIPVTGGDHLEIEIRLNPVPALHLLVHVPENNQQGSSVPVLHKREFDSNEVIRYEGAQPVSPGLLELTGIPAGKYSIRMLSSETGKREQASEIELTSDGQELDTANAEPMSTVKISVQMPPGEKLPEILSIALRDSAGRIVAFHPVDAKGEVDFGDIVPGKYVVLAPSPRKAYSVVRIASEGGVTAGHTLNVAPGSTLSITISLVGGSVSVEGLVRRGEKGVPGAMVVLVPENAESNRDRFRRDQTDLDGSFRLPNVIPGIYTVIAIEDGWDLDWSQPGVIAHYAALGQKLTVRDNGQRSIHLAESVQAQIK